VELKGGSGGVPAEPVKSYRLQELFRGCIGGESLDAMGGVEAETRLRSRYEKNEEAGVEREEGGRDAFALLGRPATEDHVEAARRQALWQSLEAPH
jgi:hypothetical protein